MIGAYATKPVLTYTEEVNGEDLWKDLGKPATTGTDAVSIAEYVLDGKTQQTVKPTLNDKNSKVGGNGTLVEVYKDGEHTYKVVAIQTYVSEVTKVTPAKGNDPATVTVDGMKYETTAYEVEDIVLYTVADGEIQSMSRPDMVSGKVTSVTTKDGKTSFVVNGTTYKWNANADTSETIKADNEYDLYLDQYGYVIMAKETKGTPDQYGVIIAKKTTEWEGNNKTYTYQLVLADGSVAEVVSKDKIDVVKNGQTVDVLVKYSVKDDEYKLTEAGTNAVNLATNTEITNGAAGLALTGSKTAYANSKTVFIVREKDGDDFTYVAYTGIGNMPSMVNVSGSVYQENGIAKLVYVTAGEYKDADDRSIYVVGDVVETVSDSTGTYNVYNAVIDGEITTIKVDKDDTNVVTKNGLYSAVYYDKNGIVTGLGTEITDSDKVASANGYAKAKDGLLTVSSDEDGDTVVYRASYADDVKVFVIDGKKIESSTLKALSGEQYSFTFSLKDGVVTAVYAAK